MRALILANTVQVVSARFSSTSLFAELCEGAEVVRAARPLRPGCPSAFLF